MQSDEAIIQQLENPSIEDVLIVTDHAATHYPQYDYLIYRKSVDAYYMKSSNEQLIHHSITMTERQINSLTAHVNTEEHELIVKDLCTSDDDQEYKFKEIDNCYVNTLALLCQCNYTLPIVEEWKNAQWSGLK